MDECLMILKKLHNKCLTPEEKTFGYMGVLVNTTFRHFFSITNDIIIRWKF